MDYFNTCQEKFFRYNFLKTNFRIMKLSFILCFVCMLQAFATGYSQTTRISLSMQDVKIEEILDKIEELSPADMLGDTELRLLQQQIIITGAVTDVNGEPLPGVTVMIKGTTQGTATGADGAFSLSVPNENAIIVFSFIGFASQEMAVGNQRTINMVLSEDTRQIDEVVVIGYGTVAKRELTSAVSHISSKEFLNIGSNNPVMQIQGKVSGVSITNTAAADPNSNTSIQIRGVTSRNASNDPLIVIDGIPGGNLLNINENDIESIDVLKDGAASAIYGTRGSNGVIIITTKKGNTDGTYKASYSGYLTADAVKKELPILNADEFRRHLPERGNDFGANTDWFDEITRVGVSHRHTIQLSGGTAKNNYRATVDYRNGKGIDIRSDRQEIGARISLNHQAANDLYKFTFNMAPRKIDYNNSDLNMFAKALIANPTMPVWDPDNPGYYFNLIGYDADNPVELLSIEKNGGMRKYLDWDGTFRLNLLPVLNPSNISHTLNTQITLAQQINDHETFWFRPSTSTLAIKAGRRGEASQERNRNIQQSLEWLGNYAYNNNGHNFKAMVGYSYQYFQYSSLYAENKDFASDGLLYNNLGNGTYNREVAGRLGLSSSKNDSKLISFFGRLTYDYQGKYLATASLRYEGSSKYGANNKWGYFPAVSVGWRISEEDFMKSIGWINELKIRADYGVTGNQNFSNYRSLATYGSYGQVLFDNRYITGWSPNRNVNPDLRWEKGKNWNFGIDFSLFNIVNGSFNYFNRKQQDILGDYNVPLPPYMFSTTFVNVGSMRNQGVELDVNIDVVRNKDFSYTVGLIGYTTNNRFTSFSDDVFTGQTYYWLDGFPAPGSPGPVQRIQEGERIGLFYAYKYAGVDDLGNWMIYNKDNETIPINQGTDEDKRAVGNGMPKFSMSFNNTLKYKNADMTLFFRGNFGYQIYDVFEFYWGLQSASANQNVLKSAYGKNAHIVQGMNAHNSYFVKDADYFKLDVATVGYTFPANNKWIESVRLYFTGRNLLIVSAYKGVDLDIFAVNGLQPGVPTNKRQYYPSTRQFIFGLQMNF